MSATFDQATYERVRDRIDHDFDSHLDRLRAYLRQPSVSSTGEGIADAAQATAELIEAASGSAEVVPTDGHPAVLGSLEGAGPRLLRYGMYDVQPAEEETWDSPPFGAVVRELPGVGPAVVARGAANSKGTLACLLLTWKSLLEVTDPPVSIKLLFDGEEELGSPHLAAVVEAHRVRLEAEAAFDLDLMADRSGVAEVSLGCKGIVWLHLVARGGDWGGPLEGALHSSTAVAVASPAWSLLRALGELVAEDESPCLEALGRPPIPPEDQPLIETLASQLDASAYCSEHGVQTLKRGLDGRDLIEALLYEPAVSLDGIHAGYPGGGKTIIPGHAEAEVDFRVPYGCDAEAALQQARDLIAAAAPEVEVTEAGICPAARTSASSRVAKAMIASHDDQGSGARVWPVAPWWAPYHLFERTLDLPFAIGGAGHCGGAHAANEYASIDGLRAHMHQTAAFLYRYVAGADDVE
jgi:acetylornithine deacetylase/succinyl-diaminopimelate desuccinylase-like protein